MMQGRRALSSQPYLPRITDRRLQEQGPGGRASNAGIRVAIFGATGFLGKHLCNQLGTCQVMVLAGIYFGGHRYLILVSIGIVKEDNVE